MILLDELDSHADNAGSSSGGPQATDALENHCGGYVTVGSNPTPSAEWSSRFSGDHLHVGV